MNARDCLVTLTAGETEAEAMVLSQADALAFAAWYAENPARMMDLVNVKMAGRPEALTWVRDALWHIMLGMGNCSDDALLGLVNIIGNRSWLSRAPHINQSQKLTCPAITVGSGPSLGRYLGVLRQVQRTHLIIAGYSTATGLIKAGIYPHIVTPIERNHDALIQGHTEATFGGSIVAPPVLTARFARHLVIPATDPMSRWVDHEGIGYGSSTGTMALAVGLTLTDGPVFLVGHDMCWDDEGDSHWDGSNGVRIKREETVLGNDGKLHPTDHWLMVFRDQIAHMAMMSERVYSPGILYKQGATIPGVLPGHIPTGGPEINPQWNGEASEYRKRLPERCELLKRDLGAAIISASTASVPEQLSAVAICGTESRGVIETILRPIYIQASLERRLGMESSAIIFGMREACSRVLAASLAAVTKALL